MRLRSIISESLRNISCGASRAFALMLAVILAGVLLGGAEAVSVVALENEAVTRIRANADVATIVGGTVDGVACERLSEAGGGPSISGAMRNGPEVEFLATPGKSLGSYEVTGGVIDLLASGTTGMRSDTSGAWVSREVAQDFGLAVGGRVQTNQGDISIAGVFDWPNDGRDTRFAYALVVPASASDGDYQECWAKQWPTSDGLDTLLYTTASPANASDGTQSQPGVTRLNKGFDAHYDAQATYLTRMTRLMPYLASAAGVLIGVVAVRRRRLEYAGALHSGQSKGAQLLGILTETMIWCGTGTICTCMLLAAYCARAVPSDTITVLMGSIRMPLALLAGTVAAVVITGLTIRESQLFRLFKHR